MKIYQSTQKTVEALQWTGDNKEEVKAFINGKMDFLFNRNSTLTIFPSHSVLFPHDYLVKKSDGFISGVDSQYFEEFFEEI